MINWLRKRFGLRWWCGRRTLIEGHAFYCTAGARGHRGEHIADDPDQIEMVRWTDAGEYRWMG